MADKLTTKASIEVKELLLQYATYNHWANRRLADVILGQNEEKLHQVSQASFGSIHQTLLHLWDASAIWWQRLKLVEHVKRPSDTPGYNTSQVLSEILKMDIIWMDWIAHASDPALTHVLAYHTSKKEMFKQPVYHLILHLFNHSSYHRGQLITMLRELEVKNLPATDFIVWSRTQKK